MYKCTECGSEYEVKPDYCDCGNDVFIEGAEVGVNDKANEGVNEGVKPKVTPKPERTSKNQIPQHNSPISIPKTDPLSLAIFLICIFLSFIVVFFLFNPKKTTEKVVEKQTVNQNIPSIEKLWKDNTPVVIKQEEPKPEPKPVVKKVVTPVAKPVQKQTVTAKPKTTQTQKQQQTSSVAKPKSTTTVTNVKKTEDEARKAAEEAAKKYEEVKKAAEDLQNSMFTKQELANYKTQLRNTIGKRIDFTRVVGDGDCAISFKIDSSGRLINGAFVKQSSNITLNDAVYKAFMNSRSYNPPPSGYKNETLTLNVRFYNGNFSISLN